MLDLVIIEFSGLSYSLTIFPEPVALCLDCWEGRSGECCFSGIQHVRKASGGEDQERESLEESEMMILDHRFQWKQADQFIMFMQRLDTSYDASVDLTSGNKREG